MNFVKSPAKAFLLFACASVSAAQANNAPIVVPDAPDVAAKAYVLMDYNSGRLLAENNAYESLNPASLTKMMTSYVIGQEIKAGNVSPDDDVTISKNAWSKNFPDSSKMFIEVGKTVKVSDLNRGIIIQSGNDACVAMAEHIAGTEGAFVDLMNSWAKQLGMRDSYFENSHGLDSDNHKSTAYDMALLGAASSVMYPTSTISTRKNLLPTTVSSSTTVTASCGITASMSTASRQATPRVPAITWYPQPPKTACA